MQNKTKLLALSLVPVMFAGMCSSACASANATASGIKPITALGTAMLSGTGPVARIENKTPDAPQPGVPLVSVHYECYSPMAYRSYSGDIPAGSYWYGPIDSQCQVSAPNYPGGRILSRNGSVFPGAAVSYPVAVYSQGDLVARVWQVAYSVVGQYNSCVDGLPNSMCLVASQDP